MFTRPAAQRSGSNVQKTKNGEPNSDHSANTCIIVKRPVSSFLLTMDSHLDPHGAECERKYLLCLLTIAEELLAMLPESVKTKYGLIKGTLALKLGGDSIIPNNSAIHSILCSGIPPQVNAAATAQILPGIAPNFNSQHNSQIPRSGPGPTNISLIGADQVQLQTDARNTWRPMLHRIYQSIHSACQQLVVRYPPQLLPPAAWPRDEELELLSLSDHALASACHDALERLLLLHEHDASRSAQRQPVHRRAYGRG